MTEAEKQTFVARMGHYLDLIGGPDGPQDSPINPKSHWRLLQLQREYGREFVKEFLDDFFRDHPSW